MKKTNEPIILWQDSAKIEEMQFSLENLVQVAQNCVDKFFEMNLPGTEKIDLYSIINNSTALVEQHIRSRIPESLELSGLKLNREKVISSGFYSLPGWDSYKEALEKFRTHPANEFLNYFKLENKIVSIDAELLDLFKSKHQIVASTPDELSLVQIWQQYINSLSNLEAVMEKYHIPIRRKSEFIKPERFVIVDKSDNLKINYLMYRELTRQKRSGRVDPGLLNG
jgi:hypothetical protein